jgi:hypothetical protein
VKTTLGTPHYIAPEVLSEKKGYFDGVCPAKVVLPVFFFGFRAFVGFVGFCGRFGLCVGFFGGLWGLWGLFSFFFSPDLFRLFDWSIS